MLSEAFYYKKDRLNQIRGFCSVVKNGSVNEAARKLNLEPATVSKQVITLERDLKIQLFDRKNKRKLVLNNNGKEFYNQSVQILQKIEGLFNHFYDETIDNNNKEIKIAGTHSAICYILPKYIKEFQKNNQDIKITILNIPFTECMEKILKEEIDISIWDNIPNSSEFKIKNIFTFKTNIIMNKDNILSNKKDKDITYNDLKKQNILMMNKYEYMELFSKIIEQYNLQGNINFINGDWEIIKNFVKLNLGIHFYYDICKKFDKNLDNDLVFKNVEHLFPDTKYNLITKNGKIFNNNMKNFLKIINANK